MKISGHKKEKDFYKYIRIIAEEAALKIEKIWKEREALVNPDNSEAIRLIHPFLQKQIAAE